MSDLIQTIVVRVDANGAIQSTERLAKSFDTVARASDGAANKASQLSPQLQRVRDLLDKTADAYQTTGQVGVRNLTQLGLMLKEVEKGYGRNIDAVNSLSAAEKNAFRSLRATYDEAILKQREYNDELQKINRSTRDFTSLQGALEGMGGTIGKITKVLGGVTLAWTAGWNIGKKIDKWLTENVAHWQEWKDKVAAAIVGAFNPLAKVTTSKLLQPGAVDAVNDPNFAGTRTLQLAAQIAARQAGARTEYLKTAGAIEEVGEAADKSTKEVKELIQELAAIPGLGQVKKAAPQSLGQFMAGMPSLMDPFEKWKGSAEEMEQFLNSEQERRQSDERAHYRALAGYWQGEQRKAAAAFEGGMSTIFTDLALTGGQNFGEIAAGALLDSVKSGAGVLSDIFNNAIMGAFGAEAAPYGPESPDAKASREERNAKRQEKIGAVFQGVLAMAGAVGANQAGQVNDTQTILNTTMTGLAIGANFTWVGAVIGAVVGLIVGVISAAVSSAGDNYSYGRMGIRDGEAFFQGNQNVSSAQARDALQRLQATFDEFYSGYLKILLKFPMEVLPNILSTMDIDPRLGKDVGGDFGRRASRMFWEDFELYLSGGLPREVAGRFEGYFREAFTGLGMSDARFHEIWTSLQGMDPKRAMELVDKWVDAVIAFKESMEFFATPLDTTVTGGLSIRPGMFQRVYDESHRSFGQQLAIDDLKIIDQARLMDSLPTGAAQIEAAADLGRMMMERYEKEKQFLREIMAGIEAIRATFQSGIDDLTMEGMVTATGAKDYEAQINFLKSRVDANRDLLSRANSPAEVQRLSGLIYDDLMRIYGLGKESGNGEAYRLWTIDQLKIVEEESVTRMHDLAKEVETANDAFMDAIHDFIDAFRGLTSEITGEDRYGLNKGKDWAGKLPVEETDGSGGPGPDAPVFYATSLSNQETGNEYLRELVELAREGQHIEINMPPSKAVLSNFEEAVVRGRGGL